MQPSIPVALNSAILSLAKERGLDILRNTHYDANNLQISWWKASVLHRLDFQPISDNEIIVNSIQETFPMFPKLLSWAWSHIPMFPYCAIKKSTKLGQVNPSLIGEDYVQQVRLFFSQVE